VVGAVLQAERLARADPTAVPAMVDGHHPEVLAERAVAGEVVEVGVGRPAVEEQDDRCAGRAADVPSERSPAPGKLDRRAVGQEWDADVVVEIGAQEPSTSMTSTRNLPFGASYSTVSPG